MGSKKQILETLSPQIRRRLSNLSLSQEIDNIIDYEIGYPCDISSASEFVGEVCDMLVQNIMSWLDDEHNFGLTPKDKDTLYYYFVDTFGDNIYERYGKMCLKGKLTESKNQYVISEGKLHNIIYNYINSHYDLEGVTMKTYEGDEDYEELYEGLIDFEGKTGERIFTYFKPEYFTDTPSNQFMIKNSPTLEVDADDYFTFNNLFNNHWKDVMKKWFEDKFKLPVNYITH
jgi:hypothetical protein